MKSDALLQSTQNILKESMDIPNEEFLTNFKNKAPKFYNICQQIDKLYDSINIKVRYNLNEKEDGTFNVDILIPLQNKTIIKCNLTSKGNCRTSIKPFILDNDTVTILTQLNKILSNFNKIS